MDEVVLIVSRFVDAAVWSLAAMLGVTLVVGTVAYCGERLRRFARLGLVLCGLAVCVTLFSVKPPAGNTNGVNQVQAPLRVPRPPSPVEPAADVVCIGGIVAQTNGVDLVLHRPPTNDLEAVEVVLVGSTNLVAATWEACTNLVFGAGGVGGLLATRIDGVFYVPVYGGNGNIMMYVDASGEIVAQYDYDPYGNTISRPPTEANIWNFGFSTKYHDWETDLAAYQLRTYNPVYGRWLNRDPVEEQGGARLFDYDTNIYSANRR